MKNVSKKIIAAVCILASFAGIPNALAYHMRKAPLTKTQKLAQRQRVMNSLLKQSAPVDRKYAAKTTTETDERLKAQTDFGNTMDSITFLPVWGLMDSFRFNYSSDRSSYFNYNYMTYYNTYQINGGGIFGFGSSVGFQDHNDAPDMLSDTSYYWQMDPFTYVWGEDETRYSIYDTNNNITDFADYYVSGVGWRYVNSYDAYTNIATSFAYEGDSLAWDSSEYRLFTYDMSHRLIMDSTNQYWGDGVWGPEEKYIYTYDGYGNIIQASYYIYDSSSTLWGEDYQYNMTYYTGTHKLQTFTEYILDTTSLVTNEVDSFGWSPGLNFITYHKQADYSFGELSDYTVYTKHITVDTLPDTMYYGFYDPTGGLVGKEFTAYNYDSHNEPTLATSYLYNDSTGLYDSVIGITHYYYEGYARHSHISGLTNVSSPTTNVKVYPNPATNEINIWMPGVARGAATYIKLINASGQVVHSESLPWMSETEKVSTAGLAPGMYWLVVQDGKGKNIHMQTVVKE